ncbi:hypothetical protein L9F63_005640, partial [Diploptera punctata]
YIPIFFFIRCEVWKLVVIGQCFFRELPLLMKPTIRLCYVLVQRCVLSVCRSRKFRIWIFNISAYVALLVFDAWSFSMPGG